jgi:hypothetical protein
MTAFRNILAGIGLTTALVTSALATDYTALRDDGRVHFELLGASIAYLVAEECDGINLRRLRIVSKALDLQSYARGLGYTNKEISAYVDSPEEQARFRAIAEPYLEQEGVTKGDAESYCTVGRALMENGTYAGTLLKGG